MRKFKEGEKVEVCSKELGFVGSYYEAKVIRHCINVYLVEYKELVVEENSAIRLKEFVSPDEVRPLPPKPPLLSTENGFKVGDVVDAFDNDGWWLGIITAKTASNEYHVYFPTTADHIAYEASRLRVHQDWINGNWIIHSGTRF